MYKNIIYVSLSDLDFQRVFAESLASVSRNLDVRTFTDTGALSESFSQSFRFRACICDEATLNGLSEDIRSDDSCILVRLTYDRESARGGNEENIIYAYEGARETAGSIAEMISERTGEDAGFLPDTERPVMIAVFSADGGTGATSVGAGIAAMIPVMYGEKVLYLGYGPFAGASVPEILKRGEEARASGDGSFSRLIYRIRKGTDFDICPFIEEGEGWGVLKTGLFTPGFKMLTDYEAERIGIIAAEGWGAGYLLIDLGNRLDENGLGILLASDIAVEVAERHGKFVYESIASERRNSVQRYLRIRNRWSGDWSSEDEGVFYISDFGELSDSSLDTRFGTELGAPVRIIVEGR